MKKDRSKKISDRLTSLLFLTILFGFFVLCVALPPKKYSENERRLLAKLPAFSTESFLSGRFTDEFEKAAPDIFPARDSFRTLKAISSKYMLGLADNNGYFTAKGHISKTEYPERKERQKANADKLRAVYEEYAAGKNCRVYLSIIPDKNYFLARQSGYLSMDYDEMMRRFADSCDFAEEIDITDTLSLDSYYTTDPHWRQEMLGATAERLLTAMGHSSEGTSDACYTEQISPYPFYGAYALQSAFPTSPDTLRYLTSPELSGCIVTDYDTGKPKKGKMIDEDKLASKDAYSAFTCGSSAVVTIENPKRKEDGDLGLGLGLGHELVIFRDSFASSIAPLLCTAYSKITLVDLRYIRSDLVGDFVNFENCDVLFLYSTMLLNGSLSM